MSDEVLTTRGLPAALSATMPVTAVAPGRIGDEPEGAQKLPVTVLLLQRTGEPMILEDPRARAGTAGISLLVGERAEGDEAGSVEAVSRRALKL